MLFGRMRTIAILRAPDEASGGGTAAAGAGAAAPGTPSGAAAIAAVAGAAAGAAGAAGTGAAAPGAATGATDAAAGAWAKPEWLPDHLSGASATEALEKTFKAFDGYRQRDAARGEIPKDAAGYTYQPPDDLKGYFRDNDPAVAELGKIAHGLKMSKGEFETLVGGFVSSMVKGGHVPPPFDAKAELGKVSKALNFADTAEGRAELGRTVADTVAFAETLGKQLGLGEGPVAMLSALADTGDGIVALNAIRARMGSRGPQVEGGHGGAGAMTAADLKAMASDPRIDPSSSKFDPRLREDYDAAYKRLHV